MQEGVGAQSSASRPPLLELDRASKHYGATRAAKQVSFSLGRGEVLALVGENGAGKSTLMNILSGVVLPDEGEVRIDGKTMHLTSPQVAQALGIGTVFQELSLAQNLSVKENIFAGRLPSRFGLVSERMLRAKASALFDSLGVTIDPDALVGELPVSSRQIAEIAKALSLNARILLLDEPTSALNADEKEVLFRLVRSLKQSGVGVIYISHHLDEVLDLADRIVVLRDGEVVSIVDRQGATPQSLVRDMVGRTIDTDNLQHPVATDEALLEVDSVSFGKTVTDASLSVRRGEIVALAGLMGSSRSELASVVVGLERPVSGEVRLRGKRVDGGGIGQAKRRGIGYVPPERKSQGLFLDLPVSANISAATLPKSSRAGILNDREIAAVARRQVGRLAIKTERIDTPVRSLSGGNQQKVLIAKWLEVEPALLVIEEPTKGVDIAAKHDIHQELRKLASAGTGILVVSSDLPEILSLAHRVLVMHQGRIVADLDCRRTNEHEIVAFASGLQE